MPQLPTLRDARSNRVALVNTAGRYADAGTAAVPKTAGLETPTEVRFLYLPSNSQPHTLGGVVQLVGQRCAKPPGFTACVRSTRTASVRRRDEG